LSVLLGGVQVVVDLGDLLVEVLVPLHEVRDPPATEYEGQSRKDRDGGDEHPLATRRRRLLDGDDRSGGGDEGLFGHGAAANPPLRIQ
jgi:hypothetical protein